MTVTDITDDMIDRVQRVLECDFAAACRLHDAALDRSIELFKATREPHTTSHEHCAKALQASLMADAVKSIIKARWPEPARAWFGAE